MMVLQSTFMEIAGALCESTRTRSSIPSMEQKRKRAAEWQHISFLHIMIKCDVLYQSDQSVASKPFNMLRPTSQMDKH